VVVSSSRVSGPVSNHSSLDLLDFLGLTCILENAKFVETMLVRMLKKCCELDQFFSRLYLAHGL
jgi:hypothetical protein